MITVAQILRSGTGTEQQMIPTNPPKDPTTAKRKPEEPDALTKATKKLRIDGPPKSKKGEELKSGLVIVRGVPPRPASAQSVHKPPSVQSSNIPPRPASVQPDHNTPISSETSNILSKRTYLNPDDRPLKPPPSISSASRKENAHTFSPSHRPSPQPTLADQAVEEDVRLMNSEADNLRERSRSSAAAISPGGPQLEFAFPPPSAKSASKTRHRTISQSDNHFVVDSTPTTSSASSRNGSALTKRVKDMIQPISEQETPQINKNRIMRGQQPSIVKKVVPANLSVANGRHPSTEPISGPSGENGYSSSTPGHRRRSSMSMRGKRISSSFDASGVLSQPHTTVSDSSLYKHIDPDLPEPERMRQLLIWATKRSMASPSSPSKAKAKAKQAASLPPLPPEGLTLLKEVQEEVIRQLMEKLIDTNVYSPPGTGNGKSNGSENEQNVMNLKRERMFLQQIEDRKNEDAAWAEVVQFYNAHQSNLFASIEKDKRQQRSRAQSSKGKARASSVEPEFLDVRVQELPEKFLGSEGYDVARALLEMGEEGVGKGMNREQDTRIKEDRIYQAIFASHQLAQITSSDLDRRFSLLSLSLSQRSQLPSSSTTSRSNISLLSNLLPTSPASHSKSDPRDLLQALAKVDATRSPSQVGSAAWKAAKDAQRVNVASAAAAADSNPGPVLERKYTEVPAPTPRKIPGTPRRHTTVTPEPGKRSNHR